MFKVGKVLNFYSKTSVAIVELSGILAVGDRIKFEREGNFVCEQKVEVIQIEYKKVDSASRGSVVALKTNEEVKEGDEIFQV
ncbi:MAG TPA: translation elongation factor-like protein [Alphaproteobacteria bacterium]|jgi:hypothetical protein|nr:translation elongation factor-like protein [Alphaproteobacteria bacterium]